MIKVLITDYLISLCSDMLTSEKCDMPFHAYEIFTPKGCWHTQMP